MKGSNSSDRLIEVVVPEPSGSSLVDRRQLDKVDRGAWCEGVVRIGFHLFSESKVLLELDRKVLCSMWSEPIPLIPKSRGAPKAAQWVWAKKQIDFVRKEGGSVKGSSGQDRTRLISSVDLCSWQGQDYRNYV